MSKMDLEFSKEELRLMLYWRERCNQAHAQLVFICPLYSLEKGTPYCHDLGDKLLNEFGRLLKESSEENSGE